MNFFAMQEHARRSSRRLVVLFLLAVVLIVIAVDVVVLFAFGGLPVSVGFGQAPLADAAQPWGVVGVTSLAVVAFIGLASLFRALSLRSGGGAGVARSMGATEVTPDSTNPAWRRLRNIIEEIAIASAVPVPQIFVMEQEPGINAFAAGYSPADAAVCVTQGSLDKLTRDELQGVIAHEFSHVLNGDMRLNIRLIGLLFGILVIGIVGRFLLYSGNSGWRSRRSKNQGGAVMIGLGLFIVGYIGYFFGRLIQAAVSRSRESLADASAVQFTRQSSGIAGALKKIAALAEGSNLGAQDTRQVAHLLFGEGLNGARMFATHPPLFERILSLDPAFQPDELAAIARAWQEPVQAADGDAPDASLSGWAPAGGAVATHANKVPGVKASATHLPGLAVPGMPGGIVGDVITGAVVAGAAGAVNAPAADLPAPDGNVGLDAASVTGQVGNPDAGDYHTASQLRQNVPAALAAATRDAQLAPALILALAVAGDAATRATQQKALAATLDPAGVATVLDLAGQMTDLHPMLRLPLAALTAPVLRRLPRPQLRALLERLQRLIDADGRVEPSEYCLAKLVQVQVIDALDPSAAFTGRTRKLAGCVDELRDLAALLASWGNADPAAAQRAFVAAMNESLPGQSVTWAIPEDWRRALDTALATLDRLGPAGKELVVRGLARAISDDGTVTVAEAELLRVVCAALHCPLPPKLQLAA